MSAGPAGEHAHVTVVPGSEDAESLFEQAPCGYLTTELDGTIVRVNATLLDWTGYARDELVGRLRFAELLTRGGQLYYETHYAPLLAMQGSASEIAFEIRRRDGSRFPVLVNATVEADAHGAPRAIRAAVFDARQRRAYERELVRMRDVEREARARTERLQHVSRALAETLEPRAIGDAVLAAIAPTEHGPPAVLLVVDHDSDLVDVLAWRGLEPSLGRTPLADDRLEPLRAVLGEHPLDTLELDGHALRELAAAGWGARVSVRRCAVAGRTVGALCVGRASLETDHEDDAFLAAVSEQCALALERTRLYAQTVAEASRARLLARVANGLNEVNDVAGRSHRLQELLVPEVADEVTLFIGDETPLLPSGAHAIPRLASHALSTRAPQIGDDGGRKVVALPLAAGGASLGVLVLLREEGREPFGDRDLALIRDIGASASAALAGARLYERERDVARTLQTSLLSGTAPHDPRMEIATYYGPAVQGLNVGGDWHDAFMPAPDRLCLVVGDIVGQGLEAASAMGRLRSAVRAFAVAGSRPGLWLEQLDSFAALDAPTRMATLVCIEVDLERRELRIASAGHPPTVLMEPGQHPRLLWEGRSPPLGVFARPTPRGEVTLRVAPGTRILLYTDGLVERREHALNVGFERLVQAAALRRTLPLGELVESIVDEFLADELTRDDVCLLALALTGVD